MAAMPPARPISLTATLADDGHSQHYDLTVGKTLDNTWQAFAVCGACGLKKQLALIDMKTVHRQPWTTVFPKLKCTEEACDGQAARLWVEKHAWGKVQIMLDLTAWSSRRRRG
jgi:hypothetical protein